MFCKAPFNHLWQETTGKIKPCCVFDSDYYSGYSSLQKAFDSEENKNFRKKMLNNDEIEGCNGCTMYQDFDSYDTENPKLRFIELSLDNNCNFKCVTCESKFSKLLYEDDLKLSKMGFDRTPMKTVINDVNLDEIDKSELQKVKFAGGEPFLNKKILHFIQSLNLSNLVVELNTNNSIFPTKWIPTLKMLKRFRCIVSLDGVYEVGEFCRYHMKMNKMTKNLMKWKELSGKRIIVSFNYVCHSLNVLNINQTKKYIDDLGFKNDQYDWYIKKYNGKPWNFKIFKMDFCKYPKHLDIGILPNETKKMIVDIAQNNEVSDYIWTKKFNHEECQKFLKYCMFLESTRKISLPKESELIFNNVAKNIS